MKFQLPRPTAKKAVLYAVIALIAASIVHAAFFKKPDIAYDTIKAERATLRQTVQVSGEVVSSTDVDLKFESVGRVKAISKKVGDVVKSGEVLATLDDRNERVRVQSAVAALQSAQASLDRLVNGATAEDVRVTEVAVANAEIALGQARQSLADAKVSNAASLEKAQSDMDSQIETLFLKTSTAMQVLKSDVFDAAGNIRNDFSSSDSGLVSQATAGFVAARSDFARMESDIAAYRAADRAGKDARIAGLLAEARTVRTSAQLSNDLMQVSTPTSLTTQAAFDVRKTNVRSAWIDLNAGVNAAESQKLSVGTTVAANSAAVNAAEQNVRASEGALESAKASLALKKAPATSYDLSSARASVTQASASLEEAIVALDRTRIRAPYDGTIAAVIARVGSTVTSNDIIMKLHGNDVYEVETDVPETDIAKLRAGLEAEVTLDAYGDDTVFPAELASIDTAQTVIQDVVYYKTRFRFTGGEQEVRAGMTATATVISAERQEAIIVPQRTIREDEDGKKYVRVLENGAEVRRDVEPGIRGDDGQVEITEGLSGGEDVIIAVREDGVVKR